MSILASTTKSQPIVGLALLPFLKKHRVQQMRVDYDAAMDTLYVNFGVDNYADESVPLEKDVWERRRSGKVVGVTVLRASKRR